MAPRRAPAWVSALRKGLMGQNGEGWTVGDIRGPTATGFAGGWAPGTVFQPHGHPGGEESVGLDGVFHDEHGTDPTGS